VLYDWFMVAVGRKGNRFGGTVNEAVVHELAVRFRIPVRLGHQPWQLADSMVKEGMSDDEYFLDLLDSTPPG
jgi:hypothetical protein